MAALLFRGWLASFGGNEKICFIDAPANNDIDCSAFSHAQGGGEDEEGAAVAAGGGCCTANGLSGASLLLLLLLLLLQSASQLAALIK